MLLYWFCKLILLAVHLYTFIYSLIKQVSGGKDGEGDSEGESNKRRGDGNKGKKSSKEKGRATKRRGGQLQFAQPCCAAVTSLIAYTHVYVHLKTGVRGLWFGAAVFSPISALALPVLNPPTSKCSAAAAASPVYIRSQMHCFRVSSYGFWFQFVAVILTLKKIICRMIVSSLASYLSFLLPYKTRLKKKRLV